MKKILSTLLLFSILLCSLMPAMASNDKYDLSNFSWKRVDSKGRGSLVFQKAPRGKSMSGHKFYTGDQIYVNLYYRESGYGIAYENGEYGYVDASYIDWGTPKTPEPKDGTRPGKDDRYNLDMYDYRRVSSKGRGSLVFQKQPKGSFMSGFKYHDGDWIYVNVNWRSQGYAMAYENGTYGYVDASYIEW